MKLVLTVIYIIFTTMGLFLMKLGGDSLVISFKKAFDFKIGYVTLLGFICYIVSFLLWQKLIVSFDLSYIVPITTGIIQVIVLLVGYFLLKESVSLVNFIGIILIIFGIVLVTIRK